MPGTGHRRSYWAFISYSHRDSAWARKIHAGIEKYRVPKRLVGNPTPLGWPVPRRLLPIFLDEAELPASADLGTDLTRSLESSHTLIVICSPNSAASRWVNEEVRHYKHIGRASRVMALIIDGEPHGSDRPEEGRPECFPLALRRQVNSNGEITDEVVEPLAADVRDKLKPGEQVLPWRLAKLKLIAGILGIPYDELRQREKERAFRRSLVWAAFSVLLLMSFAGYRMFLKQQQRKEHINTLLTKASRHIAEKHLLHGGLDLLKAAELGSPPTALKTPLEKVSRAIVPMSDVVTSAARSIETLTFSPDGQRLGVAGSDGRVSVWRLHPGGALLEHRLKLGNRSASQLVFHPAGDRIAVALWDGTVQVWPFTTLAAPTVCSGHYRKVRLNAVDIDSTGRWMASAGDDTFVKLWDTSTWSLAGTHVAEHNDFAKSVRFSPDGTLMVTAGFDGAVKVYAIPARTLVAEFQVKDAINRAVITADNRTVLAAGRSASGGTIHVGDIAEKRIVRTIDHAHANRINDLALHPDKLSFFSASDDGYARRWRIADGELLNSIEDHGFLKPDPLIVAVKILSVACSPDGKTVATAGDRGNIKLWKLSDKPPAKPERLLLSLRQRVESAFKPEVE